MHKIQTAKYPSVIPFKLVGKNGFITTCESAKGKAAIITDLEHRKPIRVTTPSNLLAFSGTLSGGELCQLTVKSIFVVYANITCAAAFGAALLPMELFTVKQIHQ